MIAQVLEIQLPYDHDHDSPDPISTFSWMVTYDRFDCTRFLWQQFYI